MVTVQENIVINKPAQVVFEILSDITRTPEFSQHIDNFTLSEIKPNILGSTFQLNRKIHGVKYHQTFEVTRCESNVTFQTTTELFGFTVVYTYTLKPLSNTTTKISLIKSASATGILRAISPLLKHVFTKPEHDGGHLNLLKCIIES